MLDCESDDSRSQCFASSHMVLGSETLEIGDTIAHVPYPSIFPDQYTDILRCLPGQTVADLAVLPDLTRGEKAAFHSSVQYER